jgi:hypothetical protein
MKKLLLGAFAIFAVITNSNAQYRPVKGAKSFTVGVNGLDFLGFNANVSRTGAVLFRKYIADNKAIRASANLTTNFNDMRLDDTTNGMTQFNTSSSYFFTIAGGLQKSLGDRARLEPYIGMDAAIGYSRNSTTQRSEVMNPDKTFQNDMKGDFVETKTKNLSPFNFGLTPVIGFNYYIADGLALGGEFGYNFNVGFTSQSKQIVSKRERGVDLPKTEIPFAFGGLNLNFQNTGFSNISLSVFF